MAEHQKPGAWGAFHPHSVWRDIDTSRIRGCYRQMMARPATRAPVDVRFYHRGLS
jgi:hypothetical protein